MMLRVVVPIIILISLFSISCPVSATAEGDFFIENMTITDTSGNNVDYYNPVSIDETIRINITLHYTGYGDLNSVKISIKPFLGSYQKYEYLPGSEIPVIDPSSEVNLSISMNNLFEIFPRMNEIDQIQKDTRISLNYSLVIKTAGTWNYIILITTDDLPDQLLGGSTIYVARNFPDYLNTLNIAFPIIIGVIMFSVILTTERKGRLS